MHCKKRSRAVARPRQVAMALAKELTQMSLPGDRQQLRRPRPHDRAARLPQDRRSCASRMPDINHDVNFLLQVLRS